MSEWTIFTTDEHVDVHEVYIKIPGFDDLYIGDAPLSDKEREISHLIAKAPKMRDMLKRLEWSNTDPTAFAVRLDGQFVAHRCPVCDHSQELEGFHAKDCALAALLKED